jgi:hypothetical protein
MEDLLNGRVKTPLSKLNALSAITSVSVEGEDTSLSADGEYNRRYVVASLTRVASVSLHSYWALCLPQSITNIRHLNDIVACNSLKYNQRL